MVTVTDMKIIIERWKKGTRPLKIHDLKSGQKVVGMLEKYDGNEFKLFDDPFEAATFILLVGMLKEQDLNSRGLAGPDTILPDQEMNRNIG
jgi:hypothetical protein